MSRAIEAQRPTSDRVRLHGWDAHLAGLPRTECPYTYGMNRAGWFAGWDARHRLSVIEASGCGRLA